MVKPQFEIGKDRLGRTGVVTSERERRLAVGKVAAEAMDAGLELKGLRQQPAARPGRKRRILPVDKARDSKDLPKIEERDAAVAALLGTIWPKH